MSSDDVAASVRNAAWLAPGAAELRGTDGIAALGVLASDGYAMADLGPPIDQSGS